MTDKAASPVPSRWRAPHRRGLTRPDVQGKLDDLDRELRGAEKATELANTDGPL